MAAAATNVTWGYAEGANQTALSTLEGLLKEDYVLAKIQDTVNMSTYISSKMQAEQTTEGRRFRFAWRFGVGEGQGNRVERGPLPLPGFGTYDQAFGDVVLRYGALDISGPAIEATQSNKGAFAQAVKQAIQDCRDGFRLEDYRQTWGDGSGTIALVKGTGTGTTIYVGHPYGLLYDETALTADQVVRPFRIGMNVYFKTAGTVTKITGVSPTAGTITVADSVSFTDGERIIRGDSSTANNDGLEYLGISAVMQATGTYLGTTRDDTPAVQANIVELAPTAPSEDALQAAFDQSEINGDGVTKPDMLLSEHLARRTYINLLATLKRFVSPTELKGGFSALDFNGVPWVTDKLAPPQQVYYLASKDFVWMTMGRGMHFADQDGRVLKWVPGYDEWQAWLVAYRQFVCKKPANQTMLRGWVTGGATES